MVGGGACDISQCKNEGITQYTCVPGQKKDGEACDDASSCTIGSTCKSGKCQSTGKERLWTHVAASSNSDMSYSDVVVSGADTYGVGARHAFSGTKRVNSFMRAVRLGVDGKLLGAWERKSDAPDAVVGAARVRRLGSGDLLIAGTLQNGASRRATVARLASDLKVSYLRDHKVYGGMVTRGMAVLPDSGAVLVGDAFDGGGSFSPLVRVSSSGHLLSANKVQSAVKNDIGDDVVAIPGGQLLIAGRTGAIDGKTYGLLQLVDVNGKVAWRRHTSLPNAGNSFLHHVRFVAGVGITVAGAQVIDGGDRSYIARFDAAGRRSWHRVSAGGANPQGAHLLDSGKLLLVGEAPSGGGADAWAMMTDPAGNPVWQQSYSGLAGSVSGSSVFVSADQLNNGFVTAGTLASSPRTRGIIVGMSAWGQRTCTSAGGCGGVGPDKCDDGKPCTLDLDGDRCTLNGCDAKGCTSKEAVCEDNNICTTNVWPEKIILGNLPVPDKHTTVRLRMHVFFWKNLQWRMNAKLQVGGKVILDDQVSKLGVSGDIGLGGMMGCNPKQFWNGTYVLKVIDVQLPHTASDLDVIFSGKPTTGDAQGWVVLANVEMWVR